MSCIKIKRNIGLLEQVYKYYNCKDTIESLYSKIECCGYEIDSNNHFHGIFDVSEIVPSILIVFTYLCTNIHTSLIKIRKEYIEHIFDLLKEIYVVDNNNNNNSIDSLKQEIVHGEYLIINTYIYNLLDKNLNIEYFSVESSYVEKHISTLDNIVLLNNDLNSKSNILVENLYYKNLYFFLAKSLRIFFIQLNFKEILTHPIINVTVNDNNKDNILSSSFLSHNYARKNIYESYIYEYIRYKIYNCCFEISDVFDFSNKITEKRLFFSISKYTSSNIIEFTYFCLKATSISFRTVIAKGYIISVKGTYTIIGINKTYKQHVLNEIFLTKTYYYSNEENNENTSLFYDINVINCSVSDIINIYALSIKIFNIKVIDVYNNKYTIRISTTLAYNLLIKIVSVVLKDRLKT